MITTLSILSSLGWNTLQSIHTFLTCLFYINGNKAIFCFYVIFHNSHHSRYMKFSCRFYHSSSYQWMNIGPFKYNNVYDKAISQIKWFLCWWVRLYQSQPWPWGLHEDCPLPRKEPRLPPLWVGALFPRPQRTPPIRSALRIPYYLITLWAPKKNLEPKPTSSCSILLRVDTLCEGSVMNDAPVTFLRTNHLKAVFFNRYSVLSILDLKNLFPLK